MACGTSPAPGSEIKPGKMVGRKLMGELVLLGRASNGKVFALRDICPHRGIPLRHGWFDGEHVQCCYHGWKFDTEGTCVDIPSTHEYQTIDFSKITCGAYPVVRTAGTDLDLLLRKRREAGRGPPAGAAHAAGLRRR